ncbi:MAG TPA: CreA family protein [Hyphomicrobiaceae bacterium]|nr:CreA family protein [Hyphomicrobiaceae bacterium]
MRKVFETSVYGATTLDKTKRPGAAHAVAAAVIAGFIAASAATPVVASDDPELIFKKTTVWRPLSPDAKLSTYVVDDPGIEGVSCYFTVPEVGGWKGWAGFAEEKSDVSLACRQTGPVVIKEKFSQGSEIYRQRRSLFFKKMQIVRGCDAKRNVLVYLTYSDRVIEGSPQNSTSTVPIMPWGNSPAPKCSEFLN